MQTGVSRKQKLISCYLAVCGEIVPGFYRFNSSFPTSTPAPFLWESFPYHEVYISYLPQIFQRKTWAKQDLPLPNGALDRSLDESSDAWCANQVAYLTDWLRQYSQNCRWGS